MRHLARLALGTLACLITTPAASAQCWEQADKLTASDAMDFLRFGWGLAASGDTLAVGAHWNVFGTNTGLVYVFERGPGGWSEVAVLAPSDGQAGDRFGSAIALEGNRLAASAPDHEIGCPGAGCSRGAVYVFERGPGGPSDWSEVAKVHPTDGVPVTGYGTTLALAGDTLVVGSQRADAVEPDAGAAYVYERDLGGPGAWGERVKLYALDGETNDFYGNSVSIDGDTLAVGAFAYDVGSVSIAGAVFLYERDLGGPDAWGERTLLTLPGGAQADRFGHSVALQGDTLAVGASGTDTPFSDSGSVHVYRRDFGGPDAWGRTAELHPEGGAGNEDMGLAVGLDGDVLIAGAPGADLASGFSAGAAYVFQRPPQGLGNWSQVAKLTSDAPAAFESFGEAVAASEGRLFVGNRKDSTLGQETGAAFVYERGPDQPVAYCTSGTSASGCQATMTACGTASASASHGFVLFASNVEGNKDGTFFYGTNGRMAMPWGNGTSYYCVVPPVRRAGLQGGVGSNGACDGSFAFDLNVQWTAKPVTNPGAGATVQAQLWYRDPLNTASKKTGLSNGLEFQVVP